VKDEAVILAQNPRYKSGVPEVKAFTASTWCSFPLCSLHQIAIMGVPEEKGNMKRSSERKVRGKRTVLKRRNKEVTT